jgi:hypothetical protein
MIIDINRKVLEQFVKDRVFMYRLVNNWAIETNQHYSWYGIGLHYGHKHLSIRPRGHTQIGIVYTNYDEDRWTDAGHIEKRILKYKGKP